MGHVLWTPQQIAPKKGRNDQGISSLANIPPTYVKHQLNFEHFELILNDFIVKTLGPKIFKLSVCVVYSFPLTP
jgi:hypothetical protein